MNFLKYITFLINTFLLMKTLISIEYIKERLRKSYVAILFKLTYIFSRGMWLNVFQRLRYIKVTHQKMLE